MTFDVSGLLIFLLAIVPGFLAQQARARLVPRPLRSQTAIEETGNYVLNSVLIHLFLLAIFRAVLALAISSDPATLGLAVAHKQLDSWAWQHRYLIASYFIASLVLGLAFGVFRGIAERDGLIGTWLADRGWLSRVLVRLGFLSFLEEAPVWYEALKQRTRQERTFVEVRMKDGGGFYTGELKSYGIVSDSERNKDFLLVNAAYKATEAATYVPMNADGILLNFADAESLAFIKEIEPFVLRDRAGKAIYSEK